ncbi:hypothetical protein SDC9_159599 [bioreactor metagenome]|uniref:Uncharacterized protein n=1 Tax=bioreactor metagenome TaxID=1076179 RepID=A0A645FJ52_9ZZZZ
MPGQRAVADGLGRTHGGNDVDEVETLFFGSRRRVEGGDALARIDGLENSLVVHLDAALLEQHAHLLRDDGYAEQRLVVRVVDDLCLAALAAPAQVVVRDEGVLQRRARALHLGAGTQEDAPPALVRECRHGLPGGLGPCWAVIDAADAILADQFFVHAFDQAVLQLHAGGDDEKVVGMDLAAFRDDLLSLRIELGYAFLHQLDARGHVLSGGGDNVARRLDA